MATMCRMKFLLVFVCLNVGMVHSWDVATSSGDNLLSFYTNDTLTRTISIESRKLYALTYDEVHNMMLYVDKHTNNDIICGYDLTSAENKCFTEGSGRNIHGLAFDPVTERVFFTDTVERSINWISLKPGFKNNGNGTVLIRVNAGIPRDIVMDSCKGHIYWLNTNLANPTIERVRTDGTEREVFETLSTIPANAYYNFEPNSLGIDQHKQRIYWMAPATTITYQLFTRVLNTKHTPFVIITVFHPKQIKVPSNTLTVSNSSVLHLEYAYEINAVYSYSKIETSETTYSNKISTKIDKKTVYSAIKMPISIVANYKIKDQIEDCEPLNQVKLALECDGHGTKVDGQSACKCTPGYTGERCDVPLCSNHCFQGNCSFNDEGLPECRSNAGYTGERCHISVCENNYCLQGNCSVNDKGLPECRCNAGYSGERCHIYVCENNYCLQGNCSVNDEGLPECSCNPGYTGQRCEVNDCQGYCLNGGECSLDEGDEPSCQCGAGYEGNRCEAEGSSDRISDTISILVNFPDKPSTYICLPSNQPFKAIKS